MGKNTAIVDEPYSPSWTLPVSPWRTGRPVSLAPSAFLCGA